MSADMTLSILGMYNQDAAENHGTFLDSDYFSLPEDFTAEDREALNALILSETAELETVYPNPETMRIVVSAWSRARVPSWERMYLALTEDYNPLHNYDRHETESGTDTGTRTETDTGTRTETDTGTRTETDTGTVTTDDDSTVTDSTSGTATDQTTGFNSNTFADDKKTLSISSGTQTVDGTKEETRNLSRGETRNLSRGETRNLSHGETRNLSRGETRNLANSRTLHAYGNIGVTTSAQMLNEELEVRKTDMFRIITDEFTEYFCVGLY